MKVHVNPEERMGILYSASGAQLIVLGSDPRFLSDEEAHRLSSSWLDAEIYEAGSPEEATEIVRRAHRKLQALYLTLFSLDPDMDVADRQESAAAAEAIIAKQPDAAGFISGVLSGEPLPPSADLSTALAFCRQQRFGALEGIFSGVGRSQQPIASAVEAFRNIPDEAIGGMANRHLYHGEIARTGLFERIAKRMGSEQQIDAFGTRLLGSTVPQHLQEIVSLWLQEAVALAGPDPHVEQLTSPFKSAPQSGAALAGVTGSDASPFKS